MAAQGRGEQREVRCRHITLAEARQISPIASGYCTDRIYRLAGRDAAGAREWRLSEERLERPLKKSYDSGRLDEWLEQYAESAPPDTLEFVAATVDGAAAGLLTWRPIRWNESIWLIDIRVREASRGTGVGTAMIESLQQTARSRRMRGIHVETQTSNYPAIRFYARCGFELSGFDEHLYANDGTASGEIGLFLFWATTGDPNH